jgi:hypothetical protein
MTDPYVLYYPPTNSYPFLLVFFSADGTNRATLDVRVTLDVVLTPGLSQTNRRATDDSSAQRSTGCRPQKRAPGPIHRAAWNLTDVRQLSETS